VPFEDALLLYCNRVCGSSQWLWAFLEEWTPLALLSTALGLGAVLLFFASTRAVRTRGLLLVALPLCAITIAEVLKQAIVRPRPMSAAYDLAARGLSSAEPLIDERSFPSGHVVTTAAVLTAFVVLFSAQRAWRWLLLGVPVLMLDRLALARHFPSDVLAAAALAFATAAVLLHLLRNGLAEVPARWKLPLALVIALGVGFAVAKPARVLDSWGAPVEGVTCAPQWQRLALEPIMGPALALARVAEPRALATALWPWLGAALLVIALLPAPCLRRRALRCAGCLLWAALVGAAGYWGLAPGDRWHATRAGIFVDLHTHGGDAVDGTITAHELVSRAAARGVEAIALTHHDAVAGPQQFSENVAVLSGLEWSADVLNRQGVMPHFLVFGEPAALSTAAVRAKELAAGERVRPEEILAEIRVMKAMDLTVVVAHDVATRSAWSEGGRVLRLPTEREYIDAGVDGFEVLHRAVPSSKRVRAANESLASLCRESRLLALGSTDAHGPFAGSPCITFLPGDFSPDPKRRAEEVLEHLRTRKAHQALLLAQPSANFRGGATLPLEVGWDYLRTMPGFARLSWLAWAALLTLLFSATRRGSEAPAQASSPR
jgi:membrane-associated phospholipid phosphatase